MTDGPARRDREPRKQRLVVLAVALAAAAAIGVGVFAAARNLPANATDPPAATPAAPASSGSATIPGAPARPTGPTREATLVRVTDGDTIRVLVEGVEERVRYIGIDTPEVRPDAPATKEPFADDAAVANARLLAAAAGGGRIVLERDVSERDHFGRMLAHVWVEADGRWTLVSLELVAQGLARASRYRPDVKYQGVFEAAEAAARRAGLGQWGSASP